MPDALGVLREVVVAAVRDSLELLPADGVEVLEVARAARVVGALLGGVLADAEVLLAQAEVEVPAAARLDPVAVPLLGLGGRDEELHLHLLELAQAEEEVAGRDLVPERLAADLRDAERRLAARELGDVLEVDEDPLRGLGAEVRGRAAVLERADLRLEHEVELARLGEVAVGRLAGALARLRPQLASSSWSARKRSLHVRQSTIGSVKPATWPDASQTRGLRMIAESRATMSSRSCTIERSQSERMLFFVRTP